MSRDIESDQGQEFYLVSPGGQELIFPCEEKPPKTKSALWVPYEEVIKDGFSSSPNWQEVLTSKDVMSLLRTIAREGKVSPRSELEDDPNKQQIIFYTAIICGNNLLFYQRAGEKSTKLASETLGDARLRGKYSIGIGGHKTEDDILSVADDLLDVVVPLVSGQLKMMIGVNRGMLAEVEEEIGVTRDSFDGSPKILGAFMDRRNVPPEDSRYQHPVGFVHLALPTIVKLSPDKVKRLRFYEREIGWAGWVPLDQVGQKLEEFQKSPFGVESWTEIFIKEFLPDLLSQNSSL